MTREARTGMIAFRPRARLLKLIGAELISDDVVAVTELVKNAYDADARKISIAFRDVTSAGGEIVVTDDGTGMSLDTVLGVWMEPGATSRAEGRRRTARRRRRVLGEKGVGRFACDKLGQHLELITRRADDARETRVLFDWDRFDSATETIGDIRNRWETRIPETIERHGTVLRISGLRAAWTERTFRRLATRLSRLCSPFRDLDDFSIVLESDEFPHYAGELRAEFLDQAPYKIDATHDADGTLLITVNGSPVDPEWTEQGSLRCGPVKARIFSFDLETEALARIGPRLEVRAWLREWSGISVYRDGFRIWPYGEPHDDWLRLDQRRVNNPVVRLSNNQVVGFVEISADRNADLRDQTNREGLLHNEAFADLRRLMYVVLETLESARQRVRHPSHVSKPHRRGSTTTVNGHATHASGPRTRDLEGWSELAAAGQAAALVSRTLRPLVADVRTNFLRLRDSINGNGTSSSRRLFGRLEALVGDLGARLDVVVGLHPDMATSRRTIDIGVELEVARDLVRPLLEAGGVQMDVALRGTRLLRAEIRPELFQHLVCILVANSLEWLRGRKKGRIRVLARPRGDRCEIIVADNGPGIPPRIASRIFDPLFSAREGGRGMGLAVARAIVELHHGDIAVLHDGRHRGAAFRILLPRKRARSTVPSR